MQVSNARGLTLTVLALSPNGDQVYPGGTVAIALGDPFPLITSGPENRSTSWAVFAFLKAFS